MATPFTPWSTPGQGLLPTKERVTPILECLRPYVYHEWENIGKQHVDSHVLLEINGWKWMTRHAIDWGKYAKLKPKVDLPNYYGVSTTFNVADLFSNRGSLTQYCSIKSQHTEQFCCVTSPNRGILWFGHGGSCWPYYPYFVLLFKSH